MAERHMQQAVFDPGEIPVVILCGGEGTRLREMSERMPKPLVDIGGTPILLHIMRIYARQGFNRFILCLGYRGIMIKEAFLEYDLRRRDLVLDMSEGRRSYVGEEDAADMDWRIVFAETGESAQTGSRIAQIAPYVNTDRFMVTYGDGVADIDLHAELAFHMRHGRIGTVAGVKPASQFGVMGVEGDDVTAFAEKPKSQSLINGGFFIFERAFLDYLSTDRGCILEREPLERLARDRQLKVFEHKGYWRCMDTFKDYRELNESFAAGVAPWLSVPGRKDAVP